MHTVTTNFNSPHFAPVMFMETLGKYRVLKHLGTGTSGAAFTVIDGDSIDEKVIKISRLLNDSFHDVRRTYNKLMSLEAMYLVHLRDCPNIITIHDLFSETVWDSHKFTCLVVNKLEVTLDQLTKDRSSISTAKKIIFGILRGVASMHRRHLTHADLKPENIGLSKDGEPIIFDLSLAKYRIEKLRPPYYLQSLLFRAPEVHLSCLLSTKIDIWSVGCILAELLKGKFLFNYDTKDAIGSLFYQFIYMLGPIPQTVLNRATTPSEYYDLFKKKQCKHNPDYLRSRLFEHINEENEKKEINNVLDLLQKMLQFDPELRISAEDAMHHPALASELSRYQLQNDLPGPAKGILPLPQTIQNDPRFPLFDTNTLIKNKNQCYTIINKHSSNDRYIYYRAKDNKNNKLILKFNRIYQDFDQKTPLIDAEFDLIQKCRIQDNLQQKILTSLSITKLYDYFYVKLSPSIIVTCAVYEYCNVNFETYMLQEVYARDFYSKFKYHMRTVLETLANFHEEKQVYGTIVPSNIVITPDWSSTKLNTAFHGSNDRILEKCYRAPELSAHGKPTMASDIFSFGCVLYKIFKGRELFKSHKEADREISLRDLFQLNPKFADLLKKMIDPNPEKRITARQACKDSFFTEIL